jgi:hypothetical protein
MKWTSIIKARKKHPHSDMSQARLDIECENDNCPAGKLGLRTMTAHGAPHWSECQMCGQAKVFDTTTEPPVVNRDDVE